MKIDEPFEMKGKLEIIDYVTTAKRLVLTLLRASRITGDVVNEIYEIQSGNDDILDEHIMCLIEILENAHKQLRGEGNE